MLILRAPFTPRSLATLGMTSGRKLPHLTSGLLVEQRVEGLARVVGRLRRSSFVRGEIPHDLRREERAFVANVLAGYARGDVLAALPKRSGIKGAAVAAGMEIGAAFRTRFLVRQVAETVTDLTALVAFERFRTKAARGASARGSFHAFGSRLGPGHLGTRTAAAAAGASGASGTITAAVLISLVFVLPIAQVSPHEEPVRRAGDDSHGDEEENEPNRQTCHLHQEPDHEDDDQQTEELWGTGHVGMRLV